jgi:hypothetical protein
MRPPPKKFTGPTHPDTTEKTEIQDSGLQPGTENASLTAAPAGGRGTGRRLALILGVIVIAIVGSIGVLNMATGDDGPVAPQREEDVPPTTEENQAPESKDQKPSSPSGDEGRANQPEGNQPQGNQQDNSSDEPIGPQVTNEKVENPSEEQPQKEEPPEPNGEKPTEKDVEKP